MSRRRSGEDGVVLLIVVALMVVSISLVYALSKTVVVDAQTAAQRHERARAQLLARSGLAIASRALVDDLNSTDTLQAGLESPIDAWALIGEQPLVTPDGAELHIRVVDGGGKIGINALFSETGERVGEHSRGFLVAALESIVERVPELRHTSAANDEELGDLADAILDWIDSDEETRIGMTEEALYDRADSKPLNRPIFSIDELADVPDMDPLLLEALRAYFSPHPLFPTQEDGGGVNPNTAPPHVLSLLYTGTEFEMRLVNEDDVFRLVKARDEGRLFCAEPGDDRCLDLTNELLLDPGQQFFPPLTYTTAIFHVTSEARLPNARACVHAVLDRSHAEAPATLYERLGC